MQGRTGGKAQFQINEHVELVFNTAAATQIIFQRTAKG